MSQDHRQEMLRRYIERMTALRDERGRQLGLADMKEVARELGMSEDDIAAADLVARSHRDRGLRHIQHRRWNDAINELREAVALDPMSVETLHPLATAHKERWLVSGSESDRRQASVLSSRAIAIDPNHDPSYVLLNALDQPRRQRARDAGPGIPRRSSVRWLFVTLGLVVAISIGLWVRAGRHHPPVELSDGGEPVIVAVEAGETELPVIWEGSREDGVSLRFASIGDGSSRIRITNIGARPIRELAIRVGRGSGDVRRIVMDASGPGDGGLGVGETRVVATGNGGAAGVSIAVESVAAE